MAKDCREVDAGQAQRTEVTELDGTALFQQENRPAGCLAFGGRQALLHAALRQRSVEMLSASAESISTVLPRLLNPVTTVGSSESSSGWLKLFRSSLVLSVR